MAQNPDREVYQGRSNIRQTDKLAAVGSLALILLSPLIYDIGSQMVGRGISFADIAAALQPRQPGAAADLRGRERLQMVTTPTPVVSEDKQLEAYEYDVLDYLASKEVEGIYDIEELRGEIRFFQDTLIYGLPKRSSELIKGQIRKGTYKITPPPYSRMYRIYRESPVEGNFQQEQWAVIHLLDSEETTFRQTDSTFKRTTRGTIAIPLSVGFDETSKGQVIGELVDRLP